MLGGLGPQVGHPRPQLEHIGATGGQLEANLEPSWANLEDLGATLEDLGAKLELLDATWENLEVILRPGHFISMLSMNSTVERTYCVQDVRKYSRI